jgi:hypothetical protein
MQVSHQFLTRPIDRVVVVGKSVPTELHELVSTLRDATPRQRDACTAFSEVRRVPYLIAVSALLTFALFLERRRRGRAYKPTPAQPSA